jgi:hypothetical protein
VLEEPLRQVLGRYIPADRIEQMAKPRPWGVIKILAISNRDGQ